MGNKLFNNDNIYTDDEIIEYVDQTYEEPIKEFASLEQWEKIPDEFINQQYEIMSQELINNNHETLKNNNIMNIKKELEIFREERELNLALNISQIKVKKQNIIPPEIYLNIEFDDYVILIIVSFCDSLTIRKIISCNKMIHNFCINQHYLEPIKLARMSIYNDSPRDSDKIIEVYRQLYGDQIGPKKLYIYNFSVNDLYCLYKKFILNKDVLIKYGKDIGGYMPSHISEVHFLRYIEKYDEELYIEWIEILPNVKMFVIKHDYVLDEFNINKYIKEICDPFNSLKPNQLEKIKFIHQKENKIRTLIYWNNGWIFKSFDVDL